MSSPTGPNLTTSPFALFQEKDGICRMNWDSDLFAASGTGEIIPLLASAIVILTSIVISADTDTNVRIVSTTAGTRGLGDVFLAANVPLILPFNPQGWGRSVRGEGLTFTEITGAAAVGVCYTWIYSLSTDGE